MAILKLIFITLTLPLLFLHSYVAVSILELQNALKTSEIDATVRRDCSKKLEDCLESEDMESETQRRLLLMQRRYISYETLRRDMIPCQKPGSSYYDCGAAQANPYSRGCEIITRCARGIKVILISQHFSLSYYSTLSASFASVPCCFFIICYCLQMEKSFSNLFWDHFLFICAHLSSICELNNNDLTRGYLFFFMGVLFLSLYTIYIWYQHQSSNGVHLVSVMIEISFSFIGNGIALIGRWFVPIDNLLWLVIGTCTMFSICVILFCYYLFASGKFKKP
ncbi:hypothetical protein J1N35_013085 [Gossypium stocksii]|uniref:Uncharacterized protein n=1 Tax=Gossypium stocksii TaxID=47602 RepID=A0A9D3VU28_9ROSI|nr:hypothetical protein J1N35_013085 [Gossypium stocksii]